MSANDGYAARLHAACAKKRSAVCVGIDPRFEMLPTEFTDGRDGSAGARAEAFAARVPIEIFSILLARRHQTVGAELFSRHEFGVGVAERACGQRLE